MEFDLVIICGILYYAATTCRTDVGVCGERIAAIGAGLSGSQEIDATRMLVTSGAVDAHVSLQRSAGSDPSSPKVLRDL